MTSHIRETTVRGEKKFELSINHPAKDGPRKRERRYFDTLKEAEAEQEAVRDRYEAHGGIWGKMKPHEQADLLACHGEALDLGTTVRGLLEYFKANSGSVKHRTMSLREMVNLTVQTKTTSRRRGRYVQELKSTLEQFARGRESLPLSQVTSAMITEFLAGKKGINGGAAEGSTLQGVIARLGVMFSIACKNNTYLDANANPMNHVEMPYVDAKTPVILAPDQAANLLWVCRATDPQFLPYLVLGLFGGIRPEELEKLRWRDIHLDDGEIVIEEGVSKTRSRRVLEIEPVLMEWLLECLSPNISLKAVGEYIFECEAKGDRLGRGEATDKILQRVRRSIKRHRKKLCKRAGVTWHQDILRKTCASFLMWKWENETKVAAMLGNSPKIIHDHYRGLLRRKDGEAFETLTPANVRNDPIELPNGGPGKKAGVLINEKEKTP